MKTDDRHLRVEMELHSEASQRVLIIEAPYYKAVSDALIEGALAVLDAAGVPYERIPVPGALEIPQVLAHALEAALFGDGEGAIYGGAIALGCVIRGETSHYDIVVNNTNHWLMETAIRHSIPLGNGVLTVDTEQQAMVRAQGGADGKGGDAARACLRLMRLQRQFAGGES
jgi:6,7-dimethyl-8-ribityllumazine synthase